MEKNHAEHSISFSHKDDNNTKVYASDASDVEILPEPTENVDHAIEIDKEIVKKEAENAEEEEEEEEEEEIKKAEEDNAVADIEGEANDNKEEKYEEDVVAEVPPETPPPNMEKVSEDIDAFINADATSEIPDCIHRFLDLVEEKIPSYDTGKTKWGEVEEEDSSLLEVVDRISKLIKLIPKLSLSPSSSQMEEEGINVKNVKDSLLMNRVGAIHQQAMSYLEDEFRLLIEESRSRTEPEPNKHNPKGKHVAEPQPPPPSSDSEPSLEAVPDFPGYRDKSISNLNNIAMKMISGGYQSECCHVYFISRRHAFEESLHKLGLEKITIDEVHKMQWEALEREIPTWNNTFKECTTVYFPSERKLAEAVFFDHPTVAAHVYGMVCHRVVIQLVNFAEALAMMKRAGEKLFKLLDMYETLRELILNLDNLFPEEFVDELKAETTFGKCRLGETVIIIFCELENSIKSDTGKTPVTGGAVHPLTRYIMNYLRLACEYQDTLEEVFKEHSKIERADSTSRSHYEAENKNENQRGNNDNKENVSPFAAQLIRVMELLDSNLEGKAKLYKDAALSSIFMMNNGRYIVQKIKGSPDLYEVMGETWCRKRSSNLRTYHKNYQIETWSKVLGCLSPKGLNDNGKVQKPVLKERFRSFNALFEEIHKTQSTWVVSDEQLQSELRVSISALVIPAYRSFLGRFSQYLDPGRQTEKYIKFQAEDTETYIDELFDGNPHHQSLARKKA